MICGYSRVFGGQLTCNICREVCQGGFLGRGQNAVDWERRRVYTSGRNTVTRLQCHNIDTRELISDTAITFIGGIAHLEEYPFYYVPEIDRLLGYGGVFGPICLINPATAVMVKVAPAPSVSASALQDWSHYFLSPDSSTIYFAVNFSNSKKVAIIAYTIATGAFAASWTVTGADLGGLVPSGTTVRGAIVPAGDSALGPGFFVSGGVTLVHVSLSGVTTLVHTYSAEVWGILRANDGNPVLHIGAYEAGSADAAKLAKVDRNNGNVIWEAPANIVNGTLAMSDANNRNTRPYVWGWIDYSFSSTAAGFFSSNDGTYHRCPTGVANPYTGFVSFDAQERMWIDSDSNFGTGTTTEVHYQCGNAIVYTSLSILDAPGPTYTFNGVTLGAAAADRVIVAIVTASTNNRTLTALTINGTPMTIHENRSGAGAGAPFFDLTVAIASLPWPTGTTATVAATFSGLGEGATLMIYRLDGLVSATPHASAFANGVGNPSLTLTTPDRGIIVAGYAGGASPANSGPVGSVTWTGVTRDLNEKPAMASTNYWLSTAAQSHMAAESRAISVSSPTHNGREILVAASWQANP
jgi:hypothetical protein